MSDRRSTERPGSSDRRSFPRPPLWLNLLLIVLGIAGIFAAREHRERVSSRFAHVIQQQARTPDDIRKVKQDLAEMDLTRDAMQKELQGRMKFAASLKSQEFYLAIDTKQKKLRFYYGDTLLREADVTPGEARTIRAGEKSWTFVPLRGAFMVEGKVVGLDWQVPEWMYAMNGQPVPAEQKVVPNGLGEYAILLPNGYAIHSPPAEESPLKGPKPGSYMVAEEDLRAIWARVHKDKTPVYIF